MLATRDKSGNLVIYFTNDKNCIVKNDEYKCWTCIGRFGSMNIPPDLLLEVKWEDEEPTEVEIMIKTK